MTVIASFNVRKCPVLFGDLLVSGYEDLQKTLNVPTIGEITKLFPKGSGFVPIELTQKVAVVNDNLAVAWSGTKLSAQIIIRELLQRAQRKAYWSLADLSQFFARFDEEHGEEVGIVGLSNDGKGVFSFGYGVYPIKFQSKKYGLIRSSGSGAENLISYLNDFDIPPGSSLTNPLETAIGNTLAISTYMLGMEKITGSNLVQYYGGGYEIVSFVNKKFTKIDDITYLVWVGNQMSDSSWKLELPKIAIKYSYYADLLMLRKAEFLAQKSGTMMCDNEVIYCISPVYRSLDNIGLKNISLPSFNSRFICSFIILYRIDGSVEVLNRINYSGKQGNPIRFRNDSSNILWMDIHSEFIESVFRNLHAEPDGSADS